MYVYYVLLEARSVELRFEWDKQKQSKESDLVALMKTVIQKRQKAMKTWWRRIQVNRTLETSSSPGKSCYIEFTYLSFGFPLEKQPRLEVKLFLTSSKFSSAVNKIIATTPRYKNTFLQSSSLHDSSSLSCFQSSHDVSGEVGSKGIKCQISSSMCIKEQQQQHADVSGVEQQSHNLYSMEQLLSVHCCISSSVMAIVCL